jgi:autotransporter-associated beta strand protein
MLSLAINGAGTQILSGPNTYRGTTTISNGTLQIGSGGAGGSLSADSAIIDNGTLVFSRSDSGLVVANGISGNGSVVQLGPGLTALTGSNSYSGATAVLGGTLQITADANLGAVPERTMPANITINGGVLQVSGVSAFNTSTISSTRSISLGPAGGGINVPTAASGTFAANEKSVQFAGTFWGQGNLTVTGGSGTNSGAAPYLLELGGESCYGGTTTINNATVNVMNNGGTGPDNVLPTTTVLNLLNNGWFVLDNENSNQALAGLTGDASGMVATTNASYAVVLTIAPPAGQTYTFPGVIGATTILGKTGSNAMLSLAINGAGTQILSGPNTYSGGTTINAGALAIATSAGIGTGTLAINAGTLQTTGDLTLDSGRTVTLGSAASTIETDTTLTEIDGLITGSGGLTKSGTGTLVITNTGNYQNGYTGGTTIAAGLLAFNSSAAMPNAGSIEFAGGSLVLNFGAGGGSVVPAALAASPDPLPPQSAMPSTPTAPVPEPASLTLLAVAAIAALLRNRVRIS